LQPDLTIQFVLEAKHSWKWNVWKQFPQILRIINTFSGKNFCVVNQIFSTWCLNKSSTIYCFEIKTFKL